MNEARSSRHQAMKAADGAVQAMEEAKEEAEEWLRVERRLNEKKGVLYQANRCVDVWSATPRHLHYRSITTPHHHTSHHHTIPPKHTTSGRCSSRKPLSRPPDLPPSIHSYAAAKYVMEAQEKQAALEAKLADEKSKSAENEAKLSELEKAYKKSKKEGDKLAEQVEGGGRREEQREVGEVGESRSVGGEG